MRNRFFLASLILSLCFINLARARALAQENSDFTPEEVVNEETEAGAGAGAMPQEEPQVTIPTESKYIAPVSMPASKPTAPKPTEPNKISLDIKGMDIVDVLKMLATRSGINIVVGKNVTGRVTLFLKDVDIWDAFEIVVLANDLAYEKKGNIVNVMTQRDYELLYGQRYKDIKEAKVVKLKYAKAADLSRALNQIKTNVGRVVVDEASNTLVIFDTPEKVEEMLDFIENTDSPIQTKVFSLKYAQADKMSAKLQEAVTKGVGSIKIDERTNKIVVTDYPSKLNEIEKIIVAFDEKAPQVLIDAQIIEIKPSDTYKMGVDWDYWLKRNLRLAASMATSGAVNKLSIGTAAEALDVKEKGQYKGIIDLLRTIGDTKILSSPRIMAINNQEAKILVGTKDAYITSTTSQSGSGTSVISQAVNFVDVGIKLYVTPTVNNDGFVTMKIKPEVSSSERMKILSEGKETEIPIVTTSEAETVVTIKDGITIIIGGLRKDQKSVTVTKIPFVGDMPFLGRLFTSESRTLSKSELVILLTPHIISENTSYTDFAEIQPEEGAVARMVNGNIITQKIARKPSKESPPGEFRTEQDYINFVWSSINKIATSYINQSDIYKGTVEITFVVNSDGQLKDEPQAISSDNYVLYAMAVRSIKDASPFPPFPEFINKSEIVFNTAFSSE